MERATQNGKKDINQDNTFKQKRIKKPYIILLLVATAMMIAIIGVILLSPQSIKTEEPSLQPVIAEPVTLRKFDQRTLNITKYEMFYRGSGMYSKEAVEFYSLVETIEKYALFHYLEQHDYKWDEEKRNFYRKLSKTELEQNVKNTNLKVYYEKMFNELQISEEEYIEYYLLPNREYEMLNQDLYNKRIGMDETGTYPSSAAADEYKNLVGITEEYLNNLAEKIPERLEPIEPQPNLPIILKNERLKVTTNKYDEYIFVDPTFISLQLEVPYSFFIYDIESEILYEDLSRFSLKRYQDAVKSYESDDPQKMELAKDFITIFEILERSIDLEYEVRVN